MRRVLAVLAAVTMVMVVWAVPAEGGQPINVVFSTDVQVRFVRGTLTIVGDGGPNRVDACADGEGAVTVMVIAGTDGGGSVDVFSTETFEGVRDLRFLMGAGDDRARVVCEPAGEDPSMIVRDVFINLGSGDDRVEVWSHTIGDDLTLLGARGFDNMSIDGVDVIDDLIVRGGADAEFLDVTSTTIGDRFDVSNGPGRSDVRADISAGRTTIRSGSSDDRVSINGDLGNTRILTGAGPDWVSLGEESGPASGTVFINTGSGNDFFATEGPQTYNVNALLGSGDDEAIFFSSTQAGERYNGGPGTDTVGFPLGLDLGDATFVNFELETSDVD